MKGGAPKGGAQKGGGPKILRHNVLPFSPVLGVFSWNFGGPSPGTPSPEPPSPGPPKFSLFSASLQCHSA